MKLPFKPLAALLACLLFPCASAAGPVQAGGLMGDFVASLEKDAEAGQAEAQFSLGEMYSEGQGVPQDYARAYRWYRQAAAQGHAEAQHSLGELYALGHGPQQSYAKALEWYVKAAAQGHAEAQYSLGELYGEGLGAPQDRGVAKMWYLKSCRSGFMRACGEARKLEDAGF